MIPACTRASTMPDPDPASNHPADPASDAPSTPAALRYKFVELPVVTDESIERTVNEWVARGWQLEGIRFVVTEASRRPSMAFVSFIREGAPAGAGEGAPEDGPEDIHDRAGDSDPQ